MIRKREGFEGQKAIVLPNKIQEVCSHAPPISSLYVTDIGFYPRARYHYRERQAGISQNILIYCVEGKGWLEVPTGLSNVNPNEFLIIPAGMPHKYGADEKNPWSIYWVHFKGKHSPEFASILSGQLKTFVKYSPFLEERIKLFDLMYQNLESGYSLDNLTYLSISFAYFLATFSFTEKFVPAHKDLKKDQVDASVIFMQNHLDVSLTLECIASSVNLSVSHFSGLFRKKTGYSPLTYFNHLKIQHACQYLQFTDLRINEIACKLGVEDPYYFSRMFTKIMGVSPNEYRHKRQ